MAESDIDCNVEIAFGKGVGDSISGGDWVNVTSDLVVPLSAPAVRASSGRRATGGNQSITPGSLRFTLENGSGDYNPQNSSSPYYGDLKSGTPVRVTTTYSATEKTRWLGFITSGFEQTVVRFYPTVEIEATDVLGVLAGRNDAWPSRIERVVDGFSDGTLTGWWRPESDGWVDSESGRVGRWTAKPSVVSPPLADTESGWNVVWDSSGEDPVPPSGFGVLPPLWPSGPTGKHVISVSWRASGHDTYSVLTQDTGPRRDLDGWGATDTIDTCGIAFYPDGPEIVVPNADGDLIWAMSTNRAASKWGWTTFGESDSWESTSEGVHHLLIAVNDSSVGSIGYGPHVWLDGQQLTYDAPIVGEFGPLVFGSPGYGAGSWPSMSRGTLDTDSPWMVGAPGRGVEADQRLGDWIDHIIVWESVTASTAELGELAADLSAASRDLGTHTLDERVGLIVGGVSLAERLGDVDSTHRETMTLIANGSPLERLQQVEDSEQGRIWVDHDGDLRFSARGWAEEDSVSSVSQLTVSNVGSQLDANPDYVEPLESGAVLAYNEGLLVNSATVSRIDGGEVTVRDADSIAQYGLKGAVSLSDLLLGTESECRSIAEWIVYSAGQQPPLQIQRLGFRIEDDETGLADFARDVEEGWLVDWILEWPDGTSSSDSGHVIGISHEWSRIGWSLTLELDATRTGHSWLEWGTEPGGYPGDATGGTFVWDNSTHGWSF